MSIFELDSIVGTGMPLVGWHNYATAGNSVVWDQTGVSNDASGGTGSALWDGTTYTKWRNEASTGDILITHYGATGLDVNYIALAAHNFGTLGITASIEAASDTTSFPDQSPSSLLHFENTGSPDIILDSTGRHTWTAVGNTFQDTSQFKFGTRSLRLDGTGDYIFSDGSIDFAFGTGDFTIDFWVRLNVTGTAQTLYDGRSASGGIPCVTIRKTSGNVLVFFTLGSNQITGTTALTTGQWYHVAVVRNSGVTRLYLNGAQEGSAYSDSNSYHSVGPYLGIDATDLTSSPFNGWIDEVRVIKGFAMNSGGSPDTFTQQTAAYANEFVQIGDSFTFTDDTPAIIRFPDSDDYTAVRLRLHSGAYEDDPISGVTGSLSTLLPFSGTDGSTTITDLAGHAWAVVGNAQIDTEQYKFGGSSLLLDGIGDYLTGDGSNSFAFGTGDFTIDFWVRPQAVSLTHVYYDGRPTATNGIYPTIYRLTNGALHYFVNGTDVITGTTILAADIWHHVAVTRSGTSTRLFLNGMQEGSTFSDSNNYINGASRPTIGADGNGPGVNPTTGNIDDLRVIKGRAKWTANFTVPTRGAGFEAEELYAGVEYVGNILEFERSIRYDADHVPMPYGRRTTVVNGMSETGQFLGRIVLGEWRESKAEFTWITPTHYRPVIDDFLEAAQEGPFFWAWHPSEYPEEVSFAWLTNDAEPATDPVTQRVHLTLEMRGTAT